MTTMTDAAPDAVAAAEKRPVRRRISPRTDFAIRRLGRLVVSLLLVVLATFFLVYLVPGDPVRAALGPTAPAGSSE